MDKSTKLAISIASCILAGSLALGLGFLGSDVQAFFLNYIFLPLKIVIFLFVMVILAILPFRISDALERNRKAQEEYEQELRLEMALRQQKEAENLSSAKVHTEAEYYE